MKVKKLHTQLEEKVFTKNLDCQQCFEEFIIEPRGKMIEKVSLKNKPQNNPYYQPLQGA